MGEIRLDMVFGFHTSVKTYGITTRTTVARICVVIDTGVVARRVSGRAEAATFRATRVFKVARSLAVAAMEYIGVHIGADVDKVALVVEDSALGFAVGAVGRSQLARESQGGVCRCRCTASALLELYRTLLPMQKSH